MRYGYTAFWSASVAEPKIYFNEVNERQATFHRRAFLMAGVAGVGLAALGTRLGYLQLVEASKYKVLSLNNEFQSRLQPPPRGLILDRNGVVLASNRPDFRLYVSRDENTDVEDLLDRLQKLVPLDDAHRSRLIDDINDAPRRAPVTVLEDLTWEEFSRINVRTPELPGVTADMGDIRVYPFSAAFAHVIGYVAKVSKDDVTSTGPNADPILLNPGMRAVSITITADSGAGGFILPNDRIDLILTQKTGGEVAHVRARTILQNVRVLAVDQTFKQDKDTKTVIAKTATLELTHGSNVTAAISGFSLGDVIAMANVNAVSFAAATGMLTLSENGVKVDTLHLLGSFTGDTFGVQQTAADAIISLHQSAG